MLPETSQTNNSCFHTYSANGHTDNSILDFEVLNCT